MEYIVAQPDVVEGVHVATIARGVATAPGGSRDAEKIAEALQKLMDDGHIYTTLDESHFKSAV